MSLALIGAVAALAVTWLAGEQHRENCIHEARTSCSVLPWDAGQRTKTSVTATPAEIREAEQILRQRAR